MKKDLIVRFPFSGFYSTFHGEILGEEVESSKHDEWDCAPDDFWDTCVVDWDRVYEAYSRKYVECILDMLGDVDESLKPSGEVVRILLTYLNLKQPREYNFGTDEIFSYIPEGVDVSEVVKWFETVKEYVDGDSNFSQELREYQREKTESRSGYIPLFNYSQLSGEWGAFHVLGDTFPTQMEFVLGMLLEEVDVDYNVNIPMDMRSRGYMDFVHEFVEFEEE